MSQLGLVKPPPPGEPWPWAGAGSPGDHRHLPSTTPPAPTPQAFNFWWILCTVGTDSLKHPNYTRLATPLGSPSSRSPCRGEGKQRGAQPDCSMEAENGGQAWRTQRVLRSAPCRRCLYTRCQFHSPSCGCCPRWLTALPPAGRLPRQPCLLAHCEWSHRHREPVGTAQHPSGGRNPTLSPSQKCSDNAGCTTKEAVGAIVRNPGRNSTLTEVLSWSEKSCLEFVGLPKNTSGPQHHNAQQARSESLYTLELGNTEVTHWHFLDQENNPGGLNTTTEALPALWKAGTGHTLKKKIRNINYRPLLWASCSLHRAGILSKENGVICN